MSDYCEVPLQPRCGPPRSNNCEPVVCEDPCEPCAPCPVKCCTRIAWPFIGWIGWLAFICEAVVVFWVAFMAINVADQNPWIIFGLLLGLIAVEVLLWIGNIWYCAPLYDCQRLRCTEGNPCDLVIRPALAYDYAMRMDFDLRHSNDQGHLQTTIVASLFALLFFGIFVGINGTASFNDLPAAPTAVQIMNFVIAEFLMGLIILAAGLAFPLYLFETRSDYEWRHFTAVSAYYKDKTGGDILYNSKLNSNASGGGVVVNSSSSGYADTGVSIRHRAANTIMALAQ